MNPVLSIVTTLYQSESYLQEFYERMTHSAREVTENYNIIMVNDGSPDASLELALTFQEKDSKVIVIDLSRNFGHHKAIMTGLQYAKGDYVFLLDSDLEEDPELLKVFWDDLKKSIDIDLICGVQRKRKGGFFEKISGALFTKVINILSGIQIPENVVLVRLMTQRYVKNLILHTEKELVFVGLVALTGFKQKCLPVIKRHKGSSTYSLPHKINLAFNYVTSFSASPLVFIFYVGLIITFLSFFFLFWIMYRSIFFQAAVGWASVIISIWLVGGVIIFFLGVIGIYLSKIFMEVKNRPRTIIKDIFLQKDV